MERIERHRSAKKQLLLYNPSVIPSKAIQDLEVLYGFLPKEAKGCLVDIMIAQQKGKFPPVAFLFFGKTTRLVPPEDLLNKLKIAEKSFEHLFTIIIEPNTEQMKQFQILYIQSSLRTKLLPASSMDSALQLMLKMHQRSSLKQLQLKRQVDEQIKRQFATREHALAMMLFNFPFLTSDECEMLLDLFGSFQRLNHATNTWLSNTGDQLN